VIVTPESVTVFLSCLTSHVEEIVRLGADPHLGAEDLLVLANYMARHEAGRVAIALALESNPVMVILFVESPEAWQHIDGLVRSVLAWDRLGRDPFRFPYDAAADPCTWGDIWQDEAARLEAELAARRAP